MEKTFFTDADQPNSSLTIFSKSLFFVTCILCILSVSGCNNEPSYAPVTDGWLQPLSTQGVHIVRPGETLYAIAWRYGRDFRDLARLNYIKPPYHLKAGQHIRLVAGRIGKVSSRSTSVARSESQATLKNTAAKTAAILPASKIVKGKDQAVISTQPVTTAPEETSVASTKTEEMGENSTPIATMGWNWPAKGKVISSYASTNGANKGIDIAGQLGAPVRATAAGKVVYSGNGLRGYGELIIIKHNDEYLSAYAHNRKLLVHEGAQVKAGQVIAEMGDSEAKQVMLHFEIRKAGKPVDPMQYLAVAKEV